MKTEGKINWIYVLLFALAGAAIINLIYNLGSISVENPDTNLAARNIESPYKLVLNGYLGLFFGFKYLGNINWLLIPLFGVYLFSNRFKLTREKWALTAFFFLAFVLISMKGFFNFRYAFTLMSFCVFMVFLLLERLTLNKKAFTAYALVVLLFIFYGFRKEFLTPRVKEKLAEVFSGQLFSEEPEHSQAITNDHLVVEDLLVELNENPVEETILVNNLPDFYYHTSLKGLYFWSGDDLYYDENGRGMLFEDRTFNQVKEFFKSKNCTHIYTHATYVGYHEGFDSFLAQECKLLIEDYEGRQLYKIHYD